METPPVAPATSDPSACQPNHDSHMRDNTDPPHSPAVSSLPPHPDPDPDAVRSVPSVPSVSVSGSGVRVAIVGCSHGELDEMYDCLQHLEATTGRQIDILLCCGDFQSVRNYTDLATMACPPKYRSMNSFYKYYTGEKKAPVLTIFIGGNHEASNYLVELFHGGWVAPNIYYMGFSSILLFAGLRIGGLSGIFNDRHYKQGHHEHAPFDRDTERSVYHVREFDVWRLLQFEKAVKGNVQTPPSTESSSSISSGSSHPSPCPIDIFLSHDWPSHIADHGNKSELIRRKKFLASEINDGSLGSPPGEAILRALQPKYWFSAHLHVKFAAVVRHEHETSQSHQHRDEMKDEVGANSNQPSLTQFLALDKCLPHRDYMQILDFPNADGPKVLCYDPVWLSIVRSTYPFLNLSRHPRPLPISRSSGESFVGSMEELDWIAKNVPKSSTGDFHPVPNNFTPTSTGWHSSMGKMRESDLPKDSFTINPQTKQFLQMLQLEDTLTPAWGTRDQPSNSTNYTHHQTNSNVVLSSSSFSSSSPSSSHPIKKQRTIDSISNPMISIPTVGHLVRNTIVGSMNPDEITIDSTVDEESPDGHTQTQTAATVNTSNPDEISIDDI